MIPTPTVPAVHIAPCGDTCYILQAKKGESEKGIPPAALALTLLPSFVLLRFFIVLFLVRSSSA